MRCSLLGRATRVFSLCPAIRWTAPAHAHRAHNLALFLTEKLFVSWSSECLKWITWDVQIACSGPLPCVDEFSIALFTTSRAPESMWQVLKGHVLHSFTSFLWQGNMQLLQLLPPSCFRHSLVYMHMRCNRCMCAATFSACFTGYKASTNSVKTLFGYKMIHDSKCFSQFGLAQSQHQACVDAKLAKWMVSFCLDTALHHVAFVRAIST